MEPVSAILTHNVVPLFAEPNSSSEQISQGILGDEVQVLERIDEFVKIRTSDDYTGWARRVHLRTLHPDELEQWASVYPNPRYCQVGQAFADVLDKFGSTHRHTKLVWGTRVIRLETLRLRTGTYALVLLPSGAYESTVGLPIYHGVVPRDALEPLGRSTDFNGQTACELAHRFIGTPYLWGGGTPFGFDCSGFVQRIYSVLGVTLPRDAYLQAQSPLGNFREPGKPLRAGDLVFFVGQSDPRGRGITHVGIALNNKHFIHAYGKTGVTLSGFDDPEIRSTYTYRGAWRLMLSRTKSESSV